MASFIELMQIRPYTPLLPALSPPTARLQQFLEPAAREKRRRLVSIIDPGQAPASMECNCAASRVQAALAPELSGRKGKVQVRNDYSKKTKMKGRCSANTCSTGGVFGTNGSSGWFIARRLTAGSSLARQS